jgi:hypothetical protein
MMRKKAKAVRVGNTEIKPISAREHKRLEKRIAARNEKRRKKYPEIHGKVIDWISHGVEDNSLFINVRFKDKTEFSMRFVPQIATHYVDLSDISTGDFKMIREYYVRRDL